MRTRVLLAAVGLAAVWLTALAPQHAGAQTAATAPTAAPTAPAQPANGVAIVPLRELPDADSLGERADRLWNGFVDFFRFGWRHSLHARRQTERDHSHFRTRDDFAVLMDAAGYKLKEIESHIGLTPGLQMSFAQVRELTEADREYVERRLHRHAMRNPGPLSAIQRMIVRTVVEASDIAGFAVEKVVIELFPLPEVKFVVAAVDAPLGMDASRIMRAIEDLNRQMRRAAPASDDLRPRAGDDPAQRRSERTAAR